MRSRPFGRCGFEVSELSLGTWGLSGDAYGPVCDEDVDRTLERALELGITLFETADVYGQGEMERKLGQRLTDPQATHVVTKIGTVLDQSPPRKSFAAADLRRAFDRSRERLDREVIDVVLLHCPTVAALRAGEGEAVLREKKASGELLAWGVSAGSFEVATVAVERGAEVLEMAYNLFVPRDLSQLDDQLQKAQTAVLARSVLAHGLLVGRWRADQFFLDADHRSARWTEETLGYRLDQLDAFRSLITGDVRSLLSAALRYVLCNDRVSSAVLGPNRVDQLSELVAQAGEGPPYLDAEALAELPSRLAAVGIEV
ncbi:MAG: aldo/keto reductase [Deltaproteobacteria bacterium]|nr:aldo/keto reductase [Deltaproteobacteria bacterium]